MIDPAHFEILPFARGEEEAAALPEPIRLTVTCSPKHGLDQTVLVASRLRSLGHRVTTHIAARMVRDRAHLGDVLATLADAGADDIFLIGGDGPEPLGPYVSATQLLPVVHEHHHRPRHIGMAGYPEGHPQISQDVLAEVLGEKSRLADYITTQLCFNSSSILGWVRALRHSGIGLPVLIGLPGVVDRLKLLEISARIGVGPSLAFLRKQGGSLLRLSAGSVEKLHKELAPHVGDPQLGIAGFHYFTFNRLVETWRFAQAHARSDCAESDIQKEVTPR